MIRASIVDGLADPADATYAEWPSIAVACVEAANPSASAAESFGERRRASARLCRTE